MKNQSKVFQIQNNSKWGKDILGLCSLVYTTRQIYQWVDRAHFPLKNQKKKYQKCWREQFHCRPTTSYFPYLSEIDVFSLCAPCFLSKKSASLAVIPPMGQVIKEACYTKYTLFTINFGEIFFGEISAIQLKSCQFFGWALFFLHQNYFKPKFIVSNVSWPLGGKAESLSESITNFRRYSKHLLFAWKYFLDQKEHQLRFLVL